MRLVPPRQVRVSQCLLCAALSAIVSLLRAFYGLSTGFRLGDESLLVYDHLHLLSSGANFLDLHFARIPSVIPDYFIARFTELVSANYLHQYLLFIFAQSFFQLWLLTLIVYVVARNRNILLSLVSVSTVSLMLDLAFPDFLRNQLYGFIPINHGGNFTLVLFFLLLLVLFFCRNLPLRHALSFRPWLIGVVFFLSLAGAASNRIFVIQAVVPTALISFYLVRFPVEFGITGDDLNALKKGLKNFSLAAVAGSLLGLLVSKIVIISGCIPPIKYDFSVIFSLSELSKYRQTGIIFGIVIILWIVVLRRASAFRLVDFEWANDAETSFILPLYFLLSSIITILLNCIISFQAAEQRYLLPLQGYSVISISLLAFVFYRSISRSRLLSLLLLSFIVVFMAPAAVGNLMNYDKYEPIDALFLEKNLPIGANVAMLTPESLTQSRVLKLHFSNNIHFSRFSSNGLPDEWDQNRNEFLDSASDFSEIRPYRYLYLSKDLAERGNLPAHFSSASDILISPQTGNQLLVFDESSGEMIDRVLKDYLAGPFRIDCF